MAHGRLGSWIKEVKDRAVRTSSSLQPWPNYYELRSKEIEAIVTASGMEASGNLLEIGCANCFNAVLLSGSATKVVATDLFNEDVKTHSQGMSVARAFIGKVGVSNCEILACSGESLPFKDGTFDTVFSMYTLEHVPDRARMLKEVRRVLKDGGKALVIVPSFMERLFFPFVFYRDMALRVFGKLQAKNPEGASKGHGVAGDPGNVPSPGSTVLGKLSRAYPHFPMPHPHGAYRTFGHEVAGYMPWHWLGLFRQSGLSVTKVFSTIVMPWELLSLIHPALPLKVYKRTMGLNIRLGKNPVLKYFGNNICFIAEKI